MMSVFIIMKNTNITALKVLNFFRGSENIQGQKETSDLYKGLKLIRELSESKEDGSDLMTIRNHKNKLMFRAFVHFFLKHSKSKREWRCNKTSERIGRLFTIHDEALIILLMINCWGLMEDKAKGVETSPNRKKDAGSPNAQNRLVLAQNLLIMLQMILVLHRL